MPYFKWKGIDFQGKIHSGQRFARSIEILSTSLLAHEIGLCHARTVRVWRQRTFSARQKVLFFRQLAALLQAGVRLYDALTSLPLISQCPVFQEALKDIANGVQEGVPFSALLRYHSNFFDELVIQLIAASEQAGCLATGLLFVTEHYESRERFIKKLRQALATPIITISFFIAITLLLGIVVVPRFESIFLMSKIPIPGSTQHLLSISLWLRTYWPIAVACGFMVATVIWASFKYVRVQQKIETALYAVPGIREIVQSLSIAYFCEACCLALKGGVPLVKALALAEEMTPSRNFKKKIELIRNQIQAGQRLSQTLSKTIFKNRPELVVLMRVGEESGILASCFSQAAALSQDEAYRRLSVAIMLIQPALLLIIGFLISLLIFALYTPLLTMSLNFEV
jgi:type IV pilus assembly protein PilC